MNIKIIIGVVTTTLVLCVYLFVSVILNKLEESAKVSAQLEQSLTVTSATLTKQIEATNSIVAITKEISKQTTKLSDETKKNTYLITKGLKQNAEINVDTSLNSDIINAMCLQWKAANSTTQSGNQSISIPPNGSTSNTSTDKCVEWKDVTTRESYEYTLILLEHIGKLNSRLQGLDKYGHSLVNTK